MLVFIVPSDREICIIQIAFGGRPTAEWRKAAEDNALAEREFWAPR